MCRKAERDPSSELSSWNHLLKLILNLTKILSHSLVSYTINSCFARAQNQTEGEGAAVQIAGNHWASSCVDEQSADCRLGYGILTLRLGWEEVFINLPPHKMQASSFTSPGTFTVLFPLENPPVLFPVQFDRCKWWGCHHCYAETSCSFTGLPFQAFLLQIT